MPRARFKGRPHQPASSGTITRPPPIPSSPDTTPATNPITAKTPRETARAGASGSSPREGRARMMPTDCQPSRAAVTNSRSVGSIHCVASAPSTAPTSPVGAIHHAAVRSTSPAFA